MVQYGGNNIRNSIQYFLHLVLFYLCAFLGAVFVLSVLFMCICCTLCVFVVLGVFVILLCVFVVFYVYLFYSYVYLLYFMCICCTSYVYLLYLLCICCTLMCICCTLCVLLYFLRVFVVPYVYLLHYVCIAVLTLDAGLLARSQYPEGPATGHLDTGFSWFPCGYKRMLRWFPSFQVATTCLSCSPPGLYFLVTFFPFHICVHVI